MSYRSRLYRAALALSRLADRLVTMVADLEGHATDDERRCTRGDCPLPCIGPSNVCLKHDLEREAARQEQDRL